MILIWLLLALLFLTAAGYFSGAEMGLYSLNRLRLRLQVGRTGDPTAAMLLQLFDRRDESVLAVLLMQNVMNYLLIVATVSLILHVTDLSAGRADIYAAIVLSPMTFVFGDVVPKNWFRSHANRLMYPTARLVHACVVGLRWTGILWLLNSLTRVFTRLTGQEQGELWFGARGEMLGMLRETAATGALTEQQARMIERVMNLSTVRVGNIMVPRDRVVRLPHDINRKVFEMIVRRHDFSRMPVLTPDRRDVAGIINIYDVLMSEAGGLGKPAVPEDAVPADGGPSTSAGGGPSSSEDGGPSTSAGAGHPSSPPGDSVLRWMRPAVTIAADASAMQALLRLRQAHEAMAIVTDPRRGFVGIVTLKDLVEEIFGELAAW